MKCAQRLIIFIFALILFMNILEAKKNLFSQFVPKFEIAAWGNLASGR